MGEAKSAEFFSHMFHSVMPDDVAIMRKNLSVRKRYMWCPTYGSLRNRQPINLRTMNTARQKPISGLITNGEKLIKHGTILPEVLAQFMESFMLGKRFSILWTLSLNRLHYSFLIMYSEKDNHVKVNFAMLVIIWFREKEGNRCSQSLLVKNDIIVAHVFYVQN